MATVSLAARSRSRAVAELPRDLVRVAAGQGSLLVTSDVPVASSSGSRASTPGDFGGLASSDRRRGRASAGGAPFVGGLLQTATRRTQPPPLQPGRRRVVTVTGYNGNDGRSARIQGSIGDHVRSR